jgi:uncharacterized protein
VTNDPIGEAKAAATRGDFESAIAILRPLAQAGDRDAQYHLGSLVLTECEVIAGRDAFSLFLKAAEQGHADAMYKLAKFPEFVSEPFKSPLSDEETWRWLLRAAELGSVQAQYDAGASLARGEWVKRPISRNLEAAFEWYLRAAEAGHPEAQYNLATMLAEGEGCNQDLHAARAWLMRAVAGGCNHTEAFREYLDSLE